MSEREDQPRISDPSPRSSEHRVDGLLVGHIVSVNGLGVPTVTYPGSPGREAVEARTTARLDSRHAGCKVALAFEAGRLDAPIVLGILFDPLGELVDQSEGLRIEREAEMDGERLVLTAEKEIVLKCGDAQIILKRDGKLMIRGTHLLSRSSGPNRIKGASVQIN